MQNIKYCPECNQTSTEAISFCPFDGTPLIEMQPAQNQPPQPAAAVQPQTVSPPSPISSKKGMNPLMIGCLAILALPLILLVWWNVNTSSHTKSANTTNISSNNTSQIETATPNSSPEVSRLSPKENLEAGKKALSQGNIGIARNHLTAIPKEAAEYASAKQLLTKVEAREKRKEIEDELKRLAIEISQQDRMMSETEYMEGTIGKNIYANALKRKAELQAQRRDAERKLKGMP